MTLRSVLVVFLLLFTMLVGARSAAADGQAIDVMASPENPPLDGAATFRAYCATCHGRSGTGDGPMASALKVPPTDLTRLTARNAGVFPDSGIQELLALGRTETPAHGSSDMPVWGPVFSALESSEQVVQTRIANLVTYLESIQRSR